MTTTESHPDIFGARDDEPVSEHLLLTAAREGSTGAFGILYARHRDHALRVARGTLGADAGLAEDVTEAAFINVFTALRNGKGPTDTLRFYLVTAVRRQAWRAQRRQRRQRETVDRWSDDPSLTNAGASPASSGAPEPSLGGHELLATAFGALSERWRHVLWLTEVEGRRPAEIAPMLGLSAGSAAALAYRARQGLVAAYLAACAPHRSEEACEALTQRLAAYLSAGRPDAGFEDVAAHIEGCASCRDVSRGVDLAGTTLGAAAPFGLLTLGWWAKGVAAGSVTKAGVALAAAAGATSAGAGGSSGGAGGGVVAGVGGAGAAGTIVGTVAAVVVTAALAAGAVAGIARLGDGDPRAAPGVSSTSQPRRSSSVDPTTPTTGGPGRPTVPGPEVAPPAIAVPDPREPMTVPSTTRPPSSAEVTTPGALVTPTIADIVTTIFETTSTSVATTIDATTSSSPETTSSTVETTSSLPETTNTTEPVDPTHGTGVLSGRIVLVDPTDGGPIGGVAGVKVVILRLNDWSRSSLVTEGNGRWSVPQLLPGRYLVSAEVPASLAPQTGIDPWVFGPTWTTVLGVVDVDRGQIDLVDLRLVDR